jgi:ABC-type Fe3+ transport system substrate-binding protein
LFKPEGSDAIDPAYKDEDGAFTAVSVNTVVYAYNSKLVPSADVPKSALDFLKPLFHGKLITTDPTEDDAGLSAFNMVVERYGWDYMDKYMAQKPTFVTSGHAAVSNAIAAGEKLATFDSTSTTPRLKAQGQPIEPVFSQVDPTPVFLVGAAIFKDAPHPNAAKLYLTWYLAKEQQSRTGTFSPRADVLPPAGMAPLSSYNIDNRYRALVSDDSRLTELRRRFGTYIARRWALSCPGRASAQLRNLGIPVEREREPGPRATRRASSRYCASRFLRWVPGLVPLRFTRPGHESTHFAR